MITGERLRVETVPVPDAPSELEMENTVSGYERVFQTRLEIFLREQYLEYLNRKDMPEEKLPYSLFLCRFRYAINSALADGHALALEERVKRVVEYDLKRKSYYDKLTTEKAEEPHMTVTEARTHPTPQEPPAIQSGSVQ